GAFSARTGLEGRGPIRCSTHRRTPYAELYAGLLTLTFAATHSPSAAPFVVARIRARFSIRGCTRCAHSPRGVPPSASGARRRLQSGRQLPPPCLIRPIPAPPPWSARPA